LILLLNKTKEKVPEYKGVIQSLLKSGKEVIFCEIKLSSFFSLVQKPKGRTRENGTEKQNISET